MIQMKKFFGFIFFLTMLNSCHEEKIENSNYVIESEIFETQLGKDKVYGISLKLKSPQNIKEFKGIKLSFYQNEKVWIDTIFAELNGSDTLISEVIFTESNSLEKGEPSYKFESFDIES